MCEPVLTCPLQDNVEETCGRFKRVCDVAEESAGAEDAAAMQRNYADLALAVDSLRAARR